MHDTTVASPNKLACICVQYNPVVVGNNTHNGGYMHTVSKHIRTTHEYTWFILYFELPTHKPSNPRVAIHTYLCE